MLCTRCGGSGGLLRKTDKLRVHKCTTCGGIGVRFHPNVFYRELRKHLAELKKH